MTGCFEKGFLERTLLEKRRSAVFVAGVAVVGEREGHKRRENGHYDGSGSLHGQIGLR